MGRPVTPREHYGAELQTLAQIVKRTAVDRRISKVRLAKIRTLVGDLTMQLTEAQAQPLPAVPKVSPPAR